MSARLPPADRSTFVRFKTHTTRWMDNDAYAHLNNVVYYSFFDSAVNEHLIEAGLLDLERSPIIGLVAETGCRYHSSLRFPDRVTVGLVVAHLGTSSVRYEVGIFRNDDEHASAEGHFVHVYVDRSTGRPVQIPQAVRTALEALAAPFHEKQA